LKINKVLNIHYFPIKIFQNPDTYSKKNPR
jgi:hypothetical protein